MKINLTQKTYINNSKFYGLTLEERASTLILGGGGKYIESYGGRFVI